MKQDIQLHHCCHCSSFIHCLRFLFFSFFLYTCPDWSEVGDALDQISTWDYITHGKTWSFSGIPPDSIQGWIQKNSDPVINTSSAAYYFSSWCLFTFYWGIVKNFYPDPDSYAAPLTFYYYYYYRNWLERGKKKERCGIDPFIVLFLGKVQKHSSPQH